MQVQDTGKLIGTIQITVKKQDGSIRKQWSENRVGKFLRKIGMEMRVPFVFGTFSDTVTVRNLITTAGKSGVASRINGSGAEAAFTYIALGTGTTAPVVGNTTLEAEIVDSGLQRAAATATRTTVNVTNDTATLSKAFSVTGTKAITEIGAFNSSSGGVRLGRQTFSAVNVINLDTVTYTYGFTVS